MACPIIMGRRTRSDSFPIKGMIDTVSFSPVWRKWVQRSGVTHTPRMFDRVVEKRADELSPPLLLLVRMIADAIVVGRMAR